MNDLELSLLIAETHMKELGLEIECDVEFFPNESKRVLFSSNVSGVYISAEKTAYVRKGSIPRMVETIAHESAHHFLLHNSELGKELIRHDVIIRMYENGEILAEIDENYRVLMLISRFVNEGFASFVGCYVLRRFADVVRSGMHEKTEYSKLDILKLNEVLSELAFTFDGRSYDYYYGRLEFERIAEVFGRQSAVVAALASMNVRYSVQLDEVIEYYSKLRGMIYRGPELSEPFMDLHPEFYSRIPHFRLLTFSRILPKFVERIYDVSPDYFLKLIERHLGREFFKADVDRLSLPLSKIRLGYLIGKFLKTGNLGVFQGYEIPDEIRVRAQYGLDVKGYCRKDPEIYAGYLLSELESASTVKAKEILRELVDLGLRDGYDMMRRVEYGDMEAVKRLIQKYVGF